MRRKETDSLSRAVAAIKPVIDTPDPINGTTVWNVFLETLADWCHSQAMGFLRDQWMRQANGEHQQEIPDPQVKDAADQYYEAGLVLYARDHGSGVRLPLLNNLIMAVELYLKSLCAEKCPLSGSTKATRVSAKPQSEHGLKGLLNAIPADYRKRLDGEFRRLYSVKLTATLDPFEQLFQESRYPYEENVDISRHPLDTLLKLSKFLHDHVANLQPIERIAGATASPEYSPSDLKKFEAKRIELLDKVNRLSNSPPQHVD